jgi:HNH endonuclease
MIERTCAQCGSSFKTERWLVARGFGKFCSHPCRIAGRRQKPLDLLFWSKVNKTETCWLWTACLNSAGYGEFCDRRCRSRLAHRVAYELLVGPIPAGLTLDHLCRVHNCINPAHLEAVTMRVNGLRGDSPPAMNARKTHCKRGHELGSNRQCRVCIRQRTNEIRRQRISMGLPRDGTGKEAIKARAREVILRQNPSLRVARPTTRTHCKRGHLLSPDNLLSASLKIGIRRCKACKRELDQAKTLENPNRYKERRARERASAVGITTP